MCIYLQPHSRQKGPPCLLALAASTIAASTPAGGGFSIGLERFRETPNHVEELVHNELVTASGDMQQIHVETTLIGSCATGHP
jgi:hypothetical protein